MKKLFLAILLLGISIPCFGGELTQYIDTDVVGGTGDGSSWVNAYSATGLWEAQNLNLTDNGGDSLTVNCRGILADTTGFNLDGWTCNATNYPTLVGDWTPPASGDMYDTTKFRLELVGAHKLKAYRTVKLENIQIKFTASGNGQNVCTLWNLNAGKIVLENCILKAVLGAYTEMKSLMANNSGTGTPTYFINCLFYDWTGAWSRPITTDIGGNTVNIYNCTFYNCERIAENRGGGTIIATNNIFHTVNTVDIYQGGGMGTITLLTNDTSNGDYFVDASGSDFHVNSDTAVVVGAGTDLATIFTTDMAGVTRSSPWTIGAFEFFVATPTPTPSTSSSSRLEQNNLELFFKRRGKRVK